MAVFSRLPKRGAQRLLVLGILVLTVPILMPEKWRGRSISQAFYWTLYGAAPTPENVRSKEAEETNGMVRPLVDVGKESAEEDPFPAMTTATSGPLTAVAVPANEKGEHSGSWETELCAEGRSKVEWQRGPEPLDLRPKWKPPELSRDVQELVRAEEQIQEGFCEVAERCKADLTDGGNYVEVQNLDLLRGSAEGGSVNMYVMKDPDIVSGSIRAQGAWEPALGDNILRLLRETATGKPEDFPVTFLDIGANIGWFSVLAAGAGFRVLAFEAMKRNARALRSTMCRNPYLAKRITLFHHAIGNETKQGCFMTSHKINEGNGNVCCGDPAVVELPEDHVFREWLPDIVRLDDYLAQQAHTIAVVKIDIEGFEELAFLGGRRTLLDAAIPYIVMEFALEGLQRHGTDPLVHLKRIQDAGYVFNLEDGGPPRTPEELYTRTDIFNIWFTHKSVSKGITTVSRRR